MKYYLASVKDMSIRQVDVEVNGTFIKHPAGHWVGATGTYHAFRESAADAKSWLMRAADRELAYHRDSIQRIQHAIDKFKDEAP
jgi:hypothetical protein